MSAAAWNTDTVDTNLVINGRTTKSTSVGMALVNEIKSLAHSAGFSKFNVQCDGSNLEQSDLLSGDFAGKTLTIVKENTAA